MAERLIEHISDTARWVAVYRAMETDRPDAHFRDPYARMLAGERGQLIADTIRGGKRSAWAMIVRTAVFDELILRCVNGKGVDTVVNLAAGLDTRAYRLSLPATLRWIDVDLPGILDYKTEKLAGETPVCKYEAVTLDLSDQPKRRELFQQISIDSKQALIVTEGLLVYLTAEQVIELSRDLAAQLPFHWWVIDIASPTLLAFLKKWYSKTMDQGGVMMKFAPEEGPDFFRECGWNPLEFRRTMPEARRLNRQMPGAWLWRILGAFSSRERKEGFLNVGTVLLEKI